MATAPVQWDETTAVPVQGQQAAPEWDESTAVPLPKATPVAQATQPSPLAAPRPIDTVEAAPAPSYLQRVGQNIRNSAVGRVLGMEPTGYVGARTNLPDVLPEWAQKPLASSPEQQDPEAIPANPQQEQVANARLRDATQPATAWLAAHPKTKATGDILDAVNQGAGQVAAGLTSPANLAMLAVAPESKLISAYFAAQATKGSFDNAEQAYQAWRAGNNPEAAKYLTESGLNAVIAGIAGTHFGRGVMREGYRTLPPGPNVEIPIEPKALPAPPAPVEAEYVGQPPAPAPSGPAPKDAEFTDARTPGAPAPKPGAVIEGEGIPIPKASAPTGKMATAEAALTGKPIDETGARPAVQASTDPAELRKSAQQQKPHLDGMAQAVASAVPGADVVGPRVKSEDSIENKEDRGKPPETNIDNLGVRVVAPNPDAVPAVQQAIESQLPVASKDKIDNNGLDIPQYGVKTGAPGDANQISELQVVPSPEVADAMTETDPLYAQQKEALVAGDKAKADEIGAKIQAKFDEARTVASEGKQGGSPEQTSGAGKPAPIVKGAAVTLPDGSGGTVQHINPNYSGGGRVVVQTPSGTKTFKGSELKAAQAPGPVGAPLPERVKQIKDIAAKGTPVKIFTARGADPEVKRWLQQHGLGNLPVTNVKGHDFGGLIDNEVNTSTNQDTALKIPQIPAGKALYVDLDGTLATEKETGNEQRISAEQPANSVADVSKEEKANADEIAGNAPRAVGERPESGAAVRGRHAEGGEAAGAVTPAGEKPGRETDVAKEVKPAFKPGDRVSISGEGFVDTKGREAVDEVGTIKKFRAASPDTQGFNQATITHPDGTETRLSWQQSAQSPIKPIREVKATPTEPQTKPATALGTPEQKTDVRREIDELLKQREEVQRQYAASPGGFTAESAKLSNQNVELTKQILAKEDELSKLNGEPTRAERREIAEKAAAKPFAERPEEPLKYGDVAQSQHWQVLEPDFIAKRFDQEIQRYERAVTEKQAEVDKLKSGSVSRTKEESTLHFWKTRLESLRSKDPRIAQKYKDEYLATVKKAISQGRPVPDAVIAQKSEFKTAVTARERYEKGMHTSFANRSAAVNDTMQAEEGYKVKRQDGKPITEEQTKEVSGGVDELVKVLGPELRDMMRGTDLTISHTNGKHPFLSDAGGMYHPAERSISAGIADVFGKPIRALAHELGHWLDYESGRVLGTKVDYPSLSGKPVKGSAYISESDKRMGFSSPAQQMYSTALKSMTDSYEVGKMLKTKNLDELSPEKRAEVERVQVVLGHYWREPREIFARLFEQYVASKLGKGGLAAESPSSYSTMPGWWNREAWAKLEPMIDAEIQKRMDAMRGKYAPVQQEEKPPVIVADPPVPKTTEKSKEKVEPTKHKFGNTQADIPPASEAGKALARARKAILPEDLAGEGMIDDALSKEKKQASLVAEPKPSAQVATIAGKMDLDEFERNGYAPEQVTRDDWTNLQRAARRAMGQSEESGTRYAPYSDYEGYHQDAVKSALKRGEEVDPEVLKDYPDLAPKELDTAKLIQQFKAEIEETEQDLKRAEAKDKQFLQEKLDAAKENLANAEKAAKEPPSSLGSTFYSNPFADPEAYRRFIIEPIKDMAAPLAKALEHYASEGRTAEAVQKGLVYTERAQRARQVRVIQTIERILKKEGFTPEDGKQVFRHVEDPSVKLTSKQAELRDNYIVPLNEAAQKQYTIAKLIQTGKFELQDILDGKVSKADIAKYAPMVDGYMHRIAAGHNSQLDRIMAGVSKGFSGSKSVLSKAYSASKHSVFQEAHSPDGQREVVAIKGGRVRQFINSANAGMLDTRIADLQDDLNDAKAAKKPNEKRIETVQNQIWALKAKRADVEGGGIASIDLGAHRSGYVTTNDLADEAVKPLEKKLEKIETEERILRATPSRMSAANARLRNIEVQKADLTKQIAAVRASIGPEQAAEEGLSQSEILAERLRPVQAQIDRITKDSQRLSEIKTRTPAQEKRLDRNSKRIAALEAQKGDIEDQHTQDGLQGRYWQDKFGGLWKFNRGTTEFISGRTGQKYYDNAILSSAVNYLETARAAQAAVTIEKQKAMLEGEGLSTKETDPGKIPDGWKGTQLMQMRGYSFPPHIADAYDQFAEKMTRGTPDILDRINRFNVQMVLMNPLMHGKNVVSNWITGKLSEGIASGRLLNPVRYVANAKAGMRALNAVWSLNEDYLHPLEQGLDLLRTNPNFDDQQEEMVRSLAAHLAADKDLLSFWQKALHLPGDALGAIRRANHTATFGMNDLLTLQAYYSALDRFEKDGVPDPEGAARDWAHRQVVEYRPPVRFLGSRGVEKALENPKLSAFWAYHSDLLRQVATAVGDAAGAGFKEDESTPRENEFGASKTQMRAQGLVKLAVLAAMAAALYPLVLDPLAKKLTGDDRAKFPRGGLPGLASNVYESSRGERDWSSTASGVFTPALGTENLMEMIANRDFFTGRHIRGTDQDLAGKTKQLADWIGKRSLPGQLAGRVDQGEGKQALFALAGFTFPMEHGLKEAAEIRRDKEGPNPPDPKKSKVFQSILAAAEQARRSSGNDTRLADALEDSGKLTKGQEGELEEAILWPPIVFAVNGMNPQEVYRVYQKSTEDERRALVSQQPTGEPVGQAPRGADRNRAAYQLSRYIDDLDGRGKTGEADKLEEELERYGFEYIDPLRQKAEPEGEGEP